MNLLIALVLAVVPAFSAPLPALKIEQNSTTVSGISSGAFMAVQLQVALSGRFSGAGSVAGGIYDCARGSAAKAQMICMMLPGTLVTNDYVERAKRRAEAGEIDSLENLKRARFYLFHSEADATVRVSALAKLQEFVETFTPKAQVRVVQVKDAAHAFPTDGYGEACDTTGSPFLVNCKRDVAGEILSQLYGRLNAPSKQPQGELVPFEQGLYADSGSSVTNEGFVYVPKSCRTGSCRLHVALHGCKMSSDFIKELFRTHAAYNRWADTNRIVVLYPNADKTLMNPNGCWDWFGATGQDYATKEGKQIQFFAKLLDALGAK